MTLEAEACDAAAFLTDEVERSPRRELPGATLGQTYARRFPKLRAKLAISLLLDQYAERLTVVGRTGEDLIWGLDLDDDAPEVELDNLLAVEEQPLQVEATFAPSGVRLRAARFVNYRVLKDVRIELDPLTVLVGPNAAGKSTLLDGLFRGSLLTTRKPLSVFDGRNAIERVHRRGATSGVRIEFFGDSGFEYHYSAGELGKPHHQFTLRAGGTPTNLASLLRTPMARCFGGAALLRLDARQLARPSYSPELRPYLRHDGLYLPSVLSYLAAEDRERLDRILAGVREVIPQVRNVRMPRTEVQHFGEPVIGNALEVDFGKTGWTPADQLSEGTLLTLGMYTILTRDPAPKMLLFDDLDRALHPNAQRRLVKQLQTLAETRCPIVCTTHSPYVLEPLDPTTVRVVRTDPNGCARVSRLVDHPKWQEWKGEMNAGEFWQYAGDEWLETEVGAGRCASWRR